MPDFKPVTMVNVRTGFELVAETAVSLNDLAGKGFARKNELKAVKKAVESDPTGEYEAPALIESSGPVDGDNTESDEKPSTQRSARKRA